jgi:hypothetical protein
MKLGSLNIVFLIPSKLGYVKGLCAHDNSSPATEFVAGASRAGGASALACNGEGGGGTRESLEDKGDRLILLNLPQNQNEVYIRALLPLRQAQILNKLKTNS